MFVHPKVNSELVLELQAFEKNDQSEIESIKQILKVSEIIKTVVRQSKITDYDEMKHVLEKTTIASEKHQRLVNVLALELDAQHGIKITGIDIEIDLDDHPQLDLDDKIIKDAREIILRDKRATCAHIQRELKIGYNKAALIIESLEKAKFLGPQVGSEPRKILKDK